MRFAIKTVLCALLILLAATAAFAQLPAVSPPPTSGALLTITNSGGTVLVSIYDSQIHSGSVKTSPCASDTLFPTDAYVLQGGSPTGCDTGDLYEVTDLTTDGGFAPRVDEARHQLAGLKDIAGFHIETHYLCAASCTGISGFGGVACNTSNTICTSASGPDTGFAIVTNNTGLDFAGTITLQGTSPTSGRPFCPTAMDANGHGVAFDSWTNGLAAGASVRLALGTQGFDGAGTSDSSNCGGFNFDQSQTINALGQSATFIFGPDKFTVTPTNITLGDTLTFRPVPMPQANFNSPLPGSTLTNSPVGNGQGCVTYASFSAKGGGNSVCPEFQTKCFIGNTTTACADAESFFWHGEIDFTVDAFSFPNGVGPGGVHFLGQKSADCTQNAFGEDIIIDYLGEPPGTDPPLHPGGKGLNCFVATYVPGAPPIPNGVLAKSFGGFEFFVDSNKLNNICPGCIEPLIWDQFDGAGGPPVTNLHWCPNPAGTTSPTGCGTSAHPVPQPWVFLEQIPFTCPDGTQANFLAGPIKPLFGLLHFHNEPNEYFFNWIVPFQERGCATVQLEYSSGTVVQGASFEIKPLF